MLNNYRVSIYGVDDLQEKYSIFIHQYFERGVRKRQGFFTWEYDVPCVTILLVHM